MHISELKELQKILNFEGEYALFRAVDEQGMYRGVINRQGEIVWNDKWRHITMRVPGYPHLFKTHDDAFNDYLYYDVEAHAFVDAPVLDEGEKSKARILADNAPMIPFFEGIPDLFASPELIYLSDDYLAFTTDCRTWGVQDVEGRIVLPNRYESVSEGGEPNQFVVSEEKHKGVIDDQGRWVIAPQYESLFWRRAYYVAYIKEPRKKRKAGLIDKAGNVLVPFEYDFLIPSHTEDLISVKKRGKCFFINSRNERVKLF